MTSRDERSAEIQADVRWYDRIEHLRVTTESAEGFDESADRLIDTYAAHRLTPELVARHGRAWNEVAVAEKAILAYLVETGQQPPTWDAV